MLENYDGPVYYVEDALEFIRKRCNLSDTVINLVLELEIDYMRSIGLIEEME